MILLPLIAAAAAGAAMPAVDCANAVTQRDMNYCAGQDYEEADRALNEEWARIAKIMKKRDADFGRVYQDGRPGFFQTLLDGQRAWLQYRDSQCTSEGYMFRGGTMEPLMVATCKTRLTKLRTEELRDLESVE